MTTASADEVERKFAVDDSAVLPDLGCVEGVESVRAPLEHDLEAVYFDTATLDLARRGMTLRRRVGGSDDGWHLKSPRAADVRRETRVPLSRSVKTVPARLRERVAAVSRGRPLVPVATVTTRRREYVLLDYESADLVHVCDDTVIAQRLIGPHRTQTWREWEVELTGGSTTLLDRLEGHLVAAGATPPAAPSKLAHALSDALPGPEPGARPAPAGGSAADLVVAYLAKHVSRLERHEAGVRADIPGSVHHLRIAARRIRSALSTYRPLFEPGSVDALREELRWLSLALSQARDAQVLRQHLDDLLAAQPPDLVLGPVRERIDSELDAAFREGRDAAREALRSDRYLRLLGALDELLLSPPLLPGADKRAARVAPRLLARDARRLRRAVSTARRCDEPGDKDRALHEVRKKAKRVRYSAESAVPVLGKRAKRIGAAAKDVQESLGTHQDSVVARRALSNFADQAHREGHSAFTFGRLHALEERRAARAERDFETAWKPLVHRMVDR